MVRTSGRLGWRRCASLVLAAALALVLSPLAPGAAAVRSAADPAQLYLVTFDGSGSAGYRGPLPLAVYRSVLTGQQDRALAAVGAPATEYRWTTALSGVAVGLTTEQADRLRGQENVLTVEANAVRTLAAASATEASASAPAGRGGRGVVIGLIDTGIAPESPLFADSPGLTPRTDRGPSFVGRCRPGEDWSTQVCNDKVVAAEWFVTGFGEDRLAADEPLSARDVRGHGTQMASLAAGNAGVSVNAPGLRRSFAGVAPRARLAAYKACWSAPDPVDDGCSTADLVAAIDRATRDGVDVLNLSVTGTPGIDTVERALLGAAEAGIVVVAAAGNDGAGGYATHESPWVTTVGSLTSTTQNGMVGFGGRRMSGTMTGRQSVTGRAVAGRSIPAPGSEREQAALCAPGSLDASAAAGRIVICERGTIGRVEKSAAVERANAVGMVLVDDRAGSPAHDLHAVPTVHLGRNAGRSFLRWSRRHPRGQATLRPVGPSGRSARVASSSSGGDPNGGVLKPDLVAPGTGLLAGTVPDASGSRWALASGTSAATAWTSGAAAVLLARRDWSAPVVRSALATSAGRVGGVLRSGAGALRLQQALRTTLAYTADPGDYRSWLRGDLREVNTPSLLVPGAGAATRRVTNVGARSGTWQVSVTGFERHDVQVSPTSLTLRPGRSAHYRVLVSGGSLVGGLDEGALVWTGSDGVEVRIPVAISR